MQLISSHIMTCTGSIFRGSSKSSLHHIVNCFMITVYWLWSWPKIKGQSPRFSLKCNRMFLWPRWSTAKVKSKSPLSQSKHNWIVSNLDPPWINSLRLPLRLAKLQGPESCWLYNWDNDRKHKSLHHITGFMTKDAPESQTVAEAARGSCKDGGGLCLILKLYVYFEP